MDNTNPDLVTNPFTDIYLDADGAGYVDCSGKRIMFSAGATAPNHNLIDLVNKLQDIHGNDSPAAHLLQAAAIFGGNETNSLTEEMIMEAVQHTGPIPLTYIREQIDISVPG